MATDWVVDASVAAKLFLPEADSSAVRAWFAALPREQRLLAPSLLRYEIGNACRKPSVPEMEQAIRRFMSGLHVVEPDEVARFAKDLSYYDAAYLALAIEQKAGLLTADAKLREAAKRHGVQVAP